MTSKKPFREVNWNKIIRYVEDNNLITFNRYLTKKGYLYILLLMELNNWSLSDLGQQLGGFTKSYVSMILNNKYKPNEKSRELIASNLNVKYRKLWKNGI